MINYSEIEKGSRIIYKNQPHEITETASVFKGRGHSTLQVKLKNLITGAVISESLHPSDSFEEANIDKLTVKFLYTHRDKYIFCKKNPSDRFELDKEKLGSVAKFLKPNQEVEAILFNDEIVSILLPIKITIKVDQAPPGVKGDRAQSGTKLITLETGAEMNVPLFVEEGDIIEINTETEEYTRRIDRTE
jgi:elongation factor P